MLNYRQHPGRTTGLVALIVVSLTAAATGTGFVVTGPAFAQPLTTATALVVEHHTTLADPSTLGRHDGSSSLDPTSRPDP